MQESIWAATGHALYGWTALKLAQSQTAVGADAFAYLWDHGYPAAHSAGLHAFHASELPFVFGNLDRTGPLWPAIEDTTQEQAMARAMGDYWVSFARDGQPVAAGNPVWPSTAAAGEVMIFGNEPRVEAAFLPGMFALHDEVVCRKQRNERMGWNWNVGVASPILGSGICR